MYCPECGKGTTRIYELIASKTIRERNPEPIHCCDNCFEDSLTGLLKKGNTIKVRLFKQ